MGRRATQVIADFAQKKAKELGYQVPFGIPAVLKAKFITQNPSDDSYMNWVFTPQNPVSDEDLQTAIEFGKEKPKEDMWILERVIERRGTRFWIYRQENTNRVTIGDRTHFGNLVQKYDSLRRQKFLSSTVLIVSTAHTITAERQALCKLRPMLNAEQWRQYVLTGIFVEKSKRSNKLYWFRKCAPIIVSELWDDEDGDVVDVPFVTLCIHPQGYYEGSSAGSLCPTDNIIAELLLMRTDEHTLWKKASQHPLEIANARF